MGEILFLYITQPEEIREMKKIFESILLFPDGFHQHGHFPYPDDFIFLKKAPDLILSKNTFCHMLPWKQ